MRRHRQIAAAPARSASEAWATLAVLIANTLERSPDIARADVEATLARASGVGRMLVAGGHLERKPLTVTAGGLVLEIVTVSADKALSLEENLNPVPGAATASDWRIYLPAASPLAALVAEVAEGDPHLSADEPPVNPDRSVGAQTAALDVEALKTWVEEGR